MRRSLVLLLSLVVSCGRESAPPLFQLLSPHATGITFANTIATNDTFNVQTDVYIYNGAGVAVGDIDNTASPTCSSAATWCPAGCTGTKAICSSKTSPNAPGSIPTGGVRARSEIGRAHV